LDTALRNRLTGAIILVLLAVLLLPELLTGSGRTPASAPVAASGDGPPLQTVVIDLSDSATAPAGVAPSATAPTPIPSLRPADEPVELPVPPAVEPLPDAGAATSPAATVAPRAAQSSAAPAAAIGAADATVARRHFVQVGTFTTRERAEVLRGDLSRRGFEVVINETARDSKPFYRVRVGPFSDRKAAEAMEVRLRPLAPDRAIVAVP
jgi:DedD protein